MRPVVGLNSHSFRAALEDLCTHDHDLARTRDQIGSPPYWRRPPGFPTLVLFILEQQVSLASAAAAYRRIVNRLGELTPERLLTATTVELRADGVSRQKDRYLRALAEAVGTGQLDLRRLSRLPDEQAQTELMKLPGIGRWTAEVYLLACLGRPDIWPVHDRALQVGIGEVLGIEPPTPGRMREIGERWRPHRSSAARLLWHSYLTRRGRAEPPLWRDRTGP